MRFIKLASVFGILAVITGAFGAHTLKGLLEPESLASFETGVRYQFYHTLAILACGVLYTNRPSPRLRIAASSFAAGIIMFSGSIYLLSTRSVTGLDGLSWLGPVTPLGGVLFIIGWIFVFIHASAESNK